MSSQQKTGTSNITYNLISIAYHALQGAEVYDTYVKDAESAGEQEIAQFFRDVQQEDRRRAERVEQLLGRRLQQR